MLVLGVILALFNIPNIIINDPVEGFMQSMLEAYQEIIEELATKDPYSLRLLLESVIPTGYNSRVKINYYTTPHSISRLRFRQVCFLSLHLQVSPIVFAERK